MSLFPTIGKDNILRGPPKEISSRSFSELMFSALSAAGSKVLLVDASTGKQVTAVNLLRDAYFVAEFLRSKKVGRGEVVAIFSENRLEYPVPLLSALLVGATAAPVNPHYVVGELKHVFNISKPKIVFCSPTVVDKLITLKPELDFLGDIVVFDSMVSDSMLTAYSNLITGAIRAPLQLTPVDVDKDVAMIFCSSGTTGMPKCVELTHRNMVTYAETLSDPRITLIQPGDAAMGLLPFYHVFGCGRLLHSLANKLKVIVLARFNEKLFLESIEKYKVTSLSLVPPLIVFLAKSPLVDKYDLSSVRTIGCGAAPLSEATQLAVAERLQINDIRQGYGMTELTVACVFSPQEGSKMGSSGVVTFGMEAKVIDLNTGNPLPAYSEGELCFRGPFVMKGYKDNPQATADTIDENGWLHTGDIGYYDNDGYLYIVDRVKELIKFKGFQVAPAELEAILLTNPNIKDAAVIGIPDEVAGELPLAYVVKQPGAVLTESDVKSFVASKVSKHKRLTGGVTFISEIPKNPSGKILRRYLRDLYKKPQGLSKL